MIDYSIDQISCVSSPTNPSATIHKVISTRINFCEIEIDDIYKVEYSFWIVLDYEIKIDKRVTFPDGLMTLSETYVPIRDKNIFWYGSSNKQWGMSQTAKDFVQESLASLIKVKAFL